MTTSQHYIEIQGIPVEIVRKNIKNLHLAVYPPAGRVRAAVPLRLKDDAVRLAIISRLSWIRRKQATFQEQERLSAREMITGESHWVQGRRYRLDVIEQSSPASVSVRNNTILEIQVRPGTHREKREEILNRWYRARLREQISKLITKWELVIEVSVKDWRIKKMKTRWGSCNVEANRIWLNLELAKKPPVCLEYILVHEIVHFIERHHNERFREHMDRFMPRWRLHREELNRAPLAHEHWGY